MRFVVSLIALVSLAAFAVACGGEREPEIRSVSTNSPVQPNDNARVVAQAPNASTCTISIGEIIRTDVNDAPRSQAPKSPERNGSVSWRFGIPLEAVPQDVPVKITCNRDGVDFFADTTVQVVERTRPIRTETPFPSPVLPTATATPTTTP